MKRLRDPKVIFSIVGVLAVISLCINFWPKGKKSSGKPWAPATAGGLGGPATGPSATNAVAATNVWPELPIDIATILTNITRWTTEPERDPFLLTEMVAVDEVTTNSPLTALKLKAIWRQTGGRAAIINDRIVMEGESIEGLKVERIEVDRVWLRGPQRIEPLVFGGVAMPQAAATPSGKGTRKPTRGVFGAEVKTPPKGGR